MIELREINTMGAMFGYLCFDDLVIMFWLCGVNPIMYTEKARPIRVGVWWRSTGYGTYTS